MNFSRALNIILAVITIASLPSVVKELYNAERPSNPKQILIGEINNTVYRPASSFKTNLQIAGQAATDSPVIETEIVIWREDGDPINKEATRRPLSITLPDGEKLLGAVKRNGPDPSEAGFLVTTRDNHVDVDWKVFDPHVVVRVALLRSGLGTTTGFSSDIGPGISVVRPKEARNYRLAITAAIVLFMACSGGLYAFVFSVKKGAAKVMGRDMEFDFSDKIFFGGLSLAFLMLAFVFMNSVAQSTEPALPTSSLSDGATGRF